MIRPLDGRTILETDGPHTPLCLRLATSLAAKIAADLGARVLKLEPQGGDLVRTAPPLLPADGRSALFQFLNTSKRSIRLPADRRAALETLLAGRIDAALYEEGDADAAALLAAHDVARVEIAGWPESMPRPHAPLSGFTVLGLGGLLDMVGEADREPLRLGGHQGSYPAGLAAFTALMAQLSARGVPPARVSLVEALLWVNWKAAAGAHADGKAPTRDGARSEFQVVPCADGHIALVYGVTQFDAVAALVGDARLDDPRFATRPERRRLITEIYDVLKPWCATRTRAEIYQAAQARGIPFGTVVTPFELTLDPQMTNRGFIVDMDGLKMPRLPVLWNGSGFAPKPLVEEPAR
ncbi:MAG: CoA transferase [Reyranellaceae bacterium]